MERSFSDLSAIFWVAFNDGNIRDGLIPQELCALKYITVWKLSKISKFYKMKNSIWKIMERWFHGAKISSFLKKIDISYQITL